MQSKSALWASFVFFLYPTSALAQSAQLGPGQSLNGELSKGDRSLDSGEYTDVYEAQLSVGQTVAVDMQSSEVDPYLVVVSPSGEQSDNDDWDGDRERARIEWTVAEPGTWTVYATTYQKGQHGSYSLSLENIRSDNPNASEQSASSGSENWTGTLEVGDEILNSGEFSDYFDVHGEAGERWILDLQSTEFDPYLGVKLPSSESMANDDYEGDRNRSLLDFVLSETGNHRVQVTSYQAKEMGDYRLSFTRVPTDSTVSPDAPNRVGVPQELRFQGELNQDDSVLGQGGEWYEVHSFEGLPGERIQARMTGEFDTYLILSGPDSFQEDNDDGPEGSSYSLIDTVLPAAGQYTLTATSYQSGQGGRYEVTVDRPSGTTNGSPPPTSTPPANPTQSLHHQGDAQEAPSDLSQRDVRRLDNGDLAAGRLTEGDLTRSSGEHYDAFAFAVEAGHTLQVSMESAAFDTYLILELPNGSKDQNDDWEGSRDISRIEFPISTSGQVRIKASSYRPGEAGEYTLKVVMHPTEEAPGQQAPTGSEGRDIYGIFVGISDYQGDDADLELTAKDAEKVHQGLLQVGMEPSNSRRLLDSQATRSNLVAAVRTLGAKMDENDLLVLFYSGHGDRKIREEFQRDDADGMDETLTLYDGDYIDDDLDALLSEHTRGQVLLVLDACFSGGFAKDVISRPGRMGLFSSQEDVTSTVAEKFQAGGYLSVFFLEAVAEKRADVDANRQITALELSQYIYERYRTEVQEAGKPSQQQRPSGKQEEGDDPTEDFVKASDNLGFQQLVVDRSGVQPSTVLFSW